MGDFRRKSLQIFRERLVIELLDVLFGIESEHFFAKLFEGFASFLREGKLIEAGAPGVGDPFAVDDGGIGGIHGKLLEADFFGEIGAIGANEVVGRACGKALALEFLFVSVAAPVGFFFEQEEIRVAEKIGAAQSGDAAADDDDVVALAYRRRDEFLSIANFVANVEMVSVELRRGGVGGGGE